MKATFQVMVIVIILLVSCTPDRKSSIPRVDFDGLEPFLHKHNDTVYVVNFWATWCKPCIEELPGFERFATEYKSRKVKVILVSLDFPNKHEETLIPFIRDREIRSTVIHMTEVNANSWIDKVSPEWSGAIPATLVYKGNERVFFEQKLDYEELKTIVEQKL